MPLDPFRSIARLAVAVMTADGHIGDAERKAMKRLNRFGPVYRFVEEEIQRAIFESADVAEACRAIRDAPPEAPAAIVAALAELAASDEGLAPREGELVARIAHELGVGEEALPPALLGH